MSRAVCDTAYRRLMAVYIVYVQGSLKWRSERVYKLFIAKTQCSDINLQCSDHHLLHISSNLPLRHKFLGKRTLGCCANRLHADSFTSSFTPKRSRRRASCRGPKGVKIAVVSNLVNMADRVTPPVLNPGCASRFEVGRCHAADTRQEDKPRRSVRTAGRSWFRSTSLCLPLSMNIKLQRAV